MGTGRIHLTTTHEGLLSCLIPLNTNSSSSLSLLSSANAVASALPAARSSSDDETSLLEISVFMRAMISPAVWGAPGGETDVGGVIVGRARRGRPRILGARLSLFASDIVTSGVVGSGVELTDEAFGFLARESEGPVWEADGVGAQSIPSSSESTSCLLFFEGDIDNLISTCFSSAESELASVTTSYIVSLALEVRRFLT